MKQFEQHGYSYIDTPSLVELNIKGDFIDAYNHHFAQIIISSTKIVHDQTVVYTSIQGWLDKNYQFFDILTLYTSQQIEDWLSANTLLLN